MLDISLDLRQKSVLLIIIDCDGEIGLHFIARSFWIFFFFAFIKLELLFFFKLEIVNMAKAGHEESSGNNQQKNTVNICAA